MRACDCLLPSPIETSEHSVCSSCGVVLDKIYENNLAFQQIAHFSNVIVGEIHPTINRTLSALSDLINMTFETRMDIIERAYQLVDSTVNYAMATEYAFSEIFPEIDIGLTTKNLKKIERVKEKHSLCGAKCTDTCEKSYLNNYLLKKMEKLGNVISSGRRRKKRIDDILVNVRIPKQTYYDNRNLAFIHVETPSQYDLKSRSKKITLDISDYILSQKNKTLEKLKDEILYKFFVDIQVSTIWRHRERFGYNGV